MQTSHPTTKLPSQYGAHKPHSGLQSGLQEESTVVQTPQSTSHPAFQYNASLHPLDTSQAHSTVITPRQSPLSAELRVQTNFQGQELGQYQDSGAKIVQTQSRPSFSTGNLPVRTSSVRSALSASQCTTGSLSPASAVSSPGVGPLMDITPLPSPLTAGTSPGPWTTVPNASQISPPNSNYGSPSSNMSIENIPPLRTSLKKNKAYKGLVSASSRATTEDVQNMEANASSHTRNRSLSEYVPGGAQVPRRHMAVSVSGSQTPTSIDPPPSVPMHREEHLAVQRGISSLPTPRPPTPPPSNRSATGSSDLGSPPSSPRPSEKLVGVQYEARTIKGGEFRRWRPIKPLGKGTFSTVMLAISENMGLGFSKEQSFDPEWNIEAEERLNPKSLVAVKICEYGPAGGADEQKIVTSLKREIDILKAIRHPSLVHLKAVNLLEKRAYLVLNYSPGGDLFELASSKFDLLTPRLVRRMFAELVAAVQHLHSQYIVHRDIKLENVLVNIPTHLLPTLPNPLRHPTPLITLTDLGLSRYIPLPPSSPLLDTPCGSSDYAAPELLMGQEYDGRATDAWALGVLLYAIMEGRLPFDSVPDARRQSPTSHRIARCEWSWVKWADGEGEWDAERGKDLEGGRECVEGLLRRAKVRWGLEKVAGEEWVKGGITVDEGLRGPDEAEDEDD